MNKTQSNITQKLFNIKELSAYLSIPTGSLYVMICKKRLPGVIKIGKSVRVLREDIDSWVNGLKRADRSLQEQTPKP